MRYPLSWLREFVDIDLTPEELAERLTVLGMQVQGVERWGADWTDVVVGELLTVEKHPRADRLSLTTVTLGTGEPLSIVCGATNIAPGQRVPVALPGAVLPGDRRIERAEKMGVVSNGMLCSGEELRLTADADGILILPADAPLGRPLAELYGDVVLDVDVKPNRGDALSILGLAREVAAATEREIRWTEPVVQEAAGEPAERRLRVDVEAPDLCTRFVGRWVDAVTIGPSPDQVQMRLLAAGQRPISNVVDASNYVMLELGKPIHTYDADRVGRGADGRATIIVRLARPGERVETLDHELRDLSLEDLLITDPNGPIGIAGVMGDASTEVSDTTRNVIVESAIFDPVAIRRTAQRHALRSEASSRFEKGQEVRLARIGADRTAQLLSDWAGGRVAPGRVDTAPKEPGSTTVPFRPARVARLLGIELPAERQRQLLARVGVEAAVTPGQASIPVVGGTNPLAVAAQPGESLSAGIPTWRRDLVIEADIAEEVARVHGFDRTPSLTPDTPMPSYRASPLEVRDLIRDSLAGAGLTEVVTPALVSPRHLEAFPIREPVESVDGEPPPTGDPIHVTNPLSQDHSILRRSLIPSLLDVASTNLRRGREELATFEVGRGYAATRGTPHEWWRLGLLLLGPFEPVAWNRPRRAADLDDAKGLIELVVRRLGLGAIRYTPVGDEPSFHPGRTAAATATSERGNATLHGLVGELHPDVVGAWELRTAERVIAAELAIAGLAAGRLPVEHVPQIGRFPAVERDLAIVLPEATAAGSVEGAIRTAGGPLLLDVRLFDVYRGEPLAAGERSLAYRLTFQSPDRTLTEDEIGVAVDGVIRAVAGVGGRIRT